jgi:hypothetical protein
VFLINPSIEAHCLSGLPALHLKDGIAPASSRAIPVDLYLDPGLINGIFAPKPNDQGI